jgi:putative oxidoreductase
MRFLERFSGPIYALFRIVFGLMFACHGAQKLFGAFGGPVADNQLIKAAGVIEFVGGLMIALGLFAGFAAFLASGTMAVAYFMQHAPNGFLPIMNRGELAVLYCFAFLYIAARGSGPWSVDDARGGARRPVAATAR